MIQSHTYNTNVCLYTLTVFLKKHSFLLGFIIGYWMSLLGRQGLLQWSRSLFLGPVYKNWHLLAPPSQLTLPQPQFPWQAQVCSLCLCLSLFHRQVPLGHILDSTYKWYHLLLSFFFWLTALNTIISSCIHVAANGIISFFLMAEQYSFTHTHTHTPTPYPLY